MATLEQIEEGIRRADRAGDTAGVRALAAERQRMLGSGSTSLTSTTPLEQQKPAGASAPTVAEDVANIAPRALRTGVEMIPAGPGETSGLMPAIARKSIEKFVDWGWTDKSTLEEFDQGYARTQADTLPGLQDIRTYITDPAFGEGQDVPAETTPGRYVKTAIENAPSSVLNPGSWASKVAQWFGGTAASEAAGQAAEELELPPWAQDTARIVAGGGGSLAPQGFNRLSNPRPIPAYRQPHIDTLRARNVPISAGQLTGSKRLMMQEDVAGGTPAHERQGDAFTQAALREQGGFPPLTERATRPVMKAELDRMGLEFDRLESQSQVPFDQSIQDDLIDATIAYTENNPHVASVVENTMNELAQNAATNGGFLSGEAYKNMRTRLNSLIGNENADPGVTGALMDMKDALDGAIQRNLPPEAQSAWRQVRAQYRNYLPIERAKATGAAQSAAEGTITPTQLRSGVRAVEGRREVASGERGMTELADAGSAVLEQPRSSGTAERQQAQRAGLGTLASGVAGAGSLAAITQLLGGGGPLSTVAGTAGALGAIALPAVRDAFIRSDVGQQILSRQGPRIDTGRTTTVPAAPFLSPTRSGQIGNPTVQVLQQLQRDAPVQTPMRHVGGAGSTGANYSPPYIPPPTLPTEMPVPVELDEPEQHSQLDFSGFEAPAIVELDERLPFNDYSPRSLRPVLPPKAQQNMAAMGLPAVLGHAAGNRMMLV